MARSAVAPTPGNCRRDHRPEGVQAGVASGLQPGIKFFFSTVGERRRADCIPNLMIRQSATRRRVPNWLLTTSGDRCSLALTIDVH
jgi:hypothetical protein